MVETKKTSIRSKVVMFTVRVRLVESKVNIHVGNVMVVKVKVRISIVGRIAATAMRKPSRVDLCEPPGEVINSFVAGYEALFPAMLFAILEVGYLSEGGLGCVCFFTKRLG